MVAQCNKDFLLFLIENQAYFVLSKYGKTIQYFPYVENVTVTSQYQKKLPVQRI